MKPSVKNSQVSKREDKKRINIRWNSGLFFQVGLIVSLLLVFLVMESDWELSPVATYDTSRERIIEEPPMIEFRVEETKPVEKKPTVTPKQEKPKVEKPKILDNVIEAKNDAPTKETDVAPLEMKNDVDPIPTSKEGEEKLPEVNKNILTVENAPIFPGCESLSTNEERRDCLNEKIRNFINKSFRTEKFSEKYSGERNRIDVMFTVNSEGQIVDVITRAPHEDLGEEAKRVVSKLPRMTPGKHNNHWVNVMYSVPIILNIEN
ncbi:MAG: hypothetical protein CL596_00785 [Alteromonas sp.]|nr:hypothetical protein [Alteromonas sp.]MAY22523.1 hypothetical protein [Flavobacteriaceae bacterium]|tara:strand:- start:24607 stop:25395 length:789 start_codon:yes stop_codon:yes gene_type:complete